MEQQTIEPITNYIEIIDSQVIEEKGTLGCQSGEVKLEIDLGDDSVEDDVITAASTPISCGVKEIAGLAALYEICRQKDITIKEAVRDILGYLENKHPINGRYSWKVNQVLLSTSTDDDACVLLDEQADTFIETDNTNSPRQIKTYILNLEKD